MREIKFRRPHFYYKDNKFSHFSYWGVLLSMGDFTVEFVSPSSNSFCYHKEDQQFSGLKDKNGKEIYEGDLLQYSDELGLSSTVYYEVFYDDGNGTMSNGFKCSRTHYIGSRCGGYIPIFNSSSIKNLVIIGNIYENPDLLNK